jgi:hypothetical protein
MNAAQINEIRKQSDNEITGSIFLPLDELALGLLYSVNQAGIWLLQVLNLDISKSNDYI